MRTASLTELRRLLASHHHLASASYGDAQDTLLHLVLCAHHHPEATRLALLHLALEHADTALVNRHNRFGRQPLHEAAGTHGSCQALRLLLDRGAEVDGMKRGNWTALMVAAHAGCCAQLETLVARGADAERRNAEGWSVFQLACQSASEEAALWLFARVQAPWRDRAENGRSALFTAALHGHERVVDLMLSRGLGEHVEHLEHGVGLLANAVVSGNAVLVRMLVHKWGQSADGVRGQKTAPIDVASDGIKVLLLELGATKGRI